MKLRLTAITEFLNRNVDLLFSRWAFGWAYPNPEVPFVVGNTCTCFAQIWAWFEHFERFPDEKPFQNGFFPCRKLAVTKVDFCNGSELCTVLKLQTPLCSLRGDLRVPPLKETSRGLKVRTLGCGNLFLCYWQELKGPLLKLRFAERSWSMPPTLKFDGGPQHTAENVKRFL